MASRRVATHGPHARPPIASATSEAARHAGLTERKGRLHVGYDVDLLLVNGTR